MRNSLLRFGRDLPSLVERAFALAQAGDCADVVALRKRLKAEGYCVRDLTGPTLLRQLREACEAASGATLKAG